jgi:hypothetical protein
MFDVPFDYFYAPVTLNVFDHEIQITRYLESRNPQIRVQDIVFFILIRTGILKTTEK